ncbi:MAG: HNH endonuclease [bacterium]|nr:HNH endonuclease [bacterium]
MPGLRHRGNRNSRGRFEGAAGVVGEAALRRPASRGARLAPCCGAASDPSRGASQDGHRCQAPGCRNSRYLQVHHRIPAAAGGKPEPKNLVTLCSRCHRALHQRTGFASGHAEPAE